LHVALILKKEPVQRARRMGIIEWLPFGKVLKMLLLYMAGERERVLQAPGSCNEHYRKVRATRSAFLRFLVKIAEF
jgi:hypothetical protein